MDFFFRTSLRPMSIFLLPNIYGYFIGLAFKIAICVYLGLTVCQLTVPLFLPSQNSWYSSLRGTSVTSISAIVILEQTFVFEFQRSERMFLWCPTCSSGILFCTCLEKFEMFKNSQPPQMSGNITAVFETLYFTIYF